MNSTSFQLSNDAGWITHQATTHHHTQAATQNHTQATAQRHTKVTTQNNTQATKQHRAVETASDSPNSRTSSID